MTMKKTGDAEKIEVAYFGEEAAIVNRYLKKIGKSVSEFSDTEKQNLQNELEGFRAGQEKVAKDVPADLRPEEEEESDGEESDDEA